MNRWLSWGFWAWSIGLIALGVAFIALLPRFNRVTEAVRLRFGRSLLIGLGLTALVFVPMTAAAAPIAVARVPIDAVQLLSYSALLLMGFA